MKQVIVKIWFWWIVIMTVFTLFSCASVQKDKHNEKYEAKKEQNNESKSKSESKSDNQSNTDLYAFLRNSNLQIKGNGSDYKLKFGDLELSGNADIQFSDNKSETKYKVITKTYNWVKTYNWTRNITKSQEFWKLTTKNKITTIDYPWYFWVILISGVMLTTIILWEKFRDYILNLKFVIRTIIFFKKLL